MRPAVLALAAGAALLVPATALAARARVPSRPQVKVLGFSTYPRVGIPPIQARPGGKIVDCQEYSSGQRDVNVVWQGWGIPRGTKMGLVLWGGPPSFAMPETPDADAMKPSRGGFTWRRRREEKVQAPYGFSFARGPFGPQSIDGTWTVKILVQGRVLARKSVTIACA